MVHSASIDLGEPEQSLLLNIARDSLEHGVRYSKPLQLTLADYSEGLQTPLGTFVTLTIDQQLRGCIGSLEAREPLALAVADAAYGAAFRDPRFPPLTESELTNTDIEISVLSPLQKIAPSGRRELLDMLEPHTDGLLLSDGRHRATFLPKVWEKLPEPEQFLDQLLLKAGLPADHWSDQLNFHRYQAILDIFQRGASCGNH